MADKPLTPEDGREEDGKFSAGNKFWLARSSHGANPKFAGPDELWEACVEYFEWVHDNPLYEAKPFHFQGHITTASLPKMRAMTIGALCLFIDVTHETWCTWRNDRPDLSEVLARVDATIRAQKFEGASADLLNPNIIARDLGLSDKVKSEVSGPEGEPLEVNPSQKLTELLSGIAKRSGTTS